MLTFFSHLLKNWPQYKQKCFCERSNTPPPTQNFSFKKCQKKMFWYFKIKPFILKIPPQTVSAFSKKFHNFFYLNSPPNSHQVWKQFCSPKAPFLSNLPFIKRTQPSALRTMSELQDVYILVLNV